MAEDEDKDFNLIEGVRLPKAFSVDAFRAGLKYKPRSDDIFLVTFPKCGTNWTGQILQLILKHGEPPKSSDLFKIPPFLELGGLKVVEEMSRPGAIITHLPYHLAPRLEQAKYLYVSRNPKDCCVSTYNHVKNLPIRIFDGNFDDHFEIFINGRSSYNDFFDHVLGWYEHRNEPNILFMTYEEIKEDLTAAILKIASFLDEEKYAEPLRKDPEILANILKYSSLEYMKETVNKRWKEIFNMTEEELEKSDLPEGFKKAFVRGAQLVKAGASEPKKHEVERKFVRKGVIGDWKNYFSEEQSKRMDAKMADRLKDTDFLNIWKKYT